MAELVVIQNSYGYLIPFTLVDSTGANRNIAGMAANFRVWNPKTNAELFNGNCTITDASTGQVTYTVKSTDFITTGFYYGSIRLTATNYVEDQLPFTVEVLPPSE